MNNITLILVIILVFLGLTFLCSKNEGYVPLGKTGSGQFPYNYTYEYNPDCIDPARHCQRSDGSTGKCQMFSICGPALMAYS
jgi:hypothetical protein